MTGGDTAGLWTVRGNCTPVGMSAAAVGVIWLQKHTQHKKDSQFTFCMLAPFVIKSVK